VGFGRSHRARLAPGKGGTSLLRKGTVIRSVVTRLIVVLGSALGILAVPGDAVAALYDLHANPLASFVWSPQLPKVGDNVVVTSTSSGRGSPITSYAWDFSDNGPFGRFERGGPVGSVGFVTPGPHVVRLRVGTADGLSSVATETITMAPLPASAGVMYPFPIVSIRGTDLRRGVRISRLAVKAPAGASIVVSCGHARCPAKSARRIAPSNRGHLAWVPFRPFERFLPAGAVLQVRVSQPGKIGAYTRFHVRRRKFPVRSDSCLESAGVKPIACPRS
jgi:hypothetical protein